VQWHGIPSLILKLPNANLPLLFILYMHSLCNIMSFKSHVELSNLRSVQETAASEALTCSPPAAMVVAENTLCHESSCLSASVDAFLSQPLSTIQHDSTEVYHWTAHVYSITPFQIFISQKILHKVLMQVSRGTSSKQSIHYLVNKLKTTGSFLDKKPNRKQTETENKIW
jgi:hypothetical protein